MTNRQRDRLTALLEAHAEIAEEIGDWKVRTAEGDRFAEGHTNGLYEALNVVEALIDGEAIDEQPEDTEPENPIAQYDNQVYVTGEGVAECINCGEEIPVSDYYDTTCPECGEHPRVNSSYHDETAICYDCGEEIDRIEPGEDYPTCPKCGGNPLPPVGHSGGAVDEWVNENSASNDDYELDGEDEDRIRDEHLDSGRVAHLLDRLEDEYTNVKEMIATLRRVPDDGYAYADEIHEATLTHDVATTRGYLMILEEEGLVKDSPSGYTKASVAPLVIELFEHRERKRYTGEH